MWGEKRGEDALEQLLCLGNIFNIPLSPSSSIFLADMNCSYIKNVAVVFYEGETLLMPK